MRSHRLSRAAIAALSAAVVPVSATFAATPPAIGSSSIPLTLEGVTTFTGGPPLDLTHAPDGTDRLFIAGQVNGQIKIYKNGALQSTAFLDIPASLISGGAGITLSGGSEKGLLGIAFHPNFNAAVGTPGRGKFYTYTTEGKAATVDFSHPELGGTSGTGGDSDSVFREWTVSAANPDRIDLSAGANSSRELLRIRQPQSNHNGGAIRFGLDGYMYIALGDGGGGNDNQGGFTATDGHTNNDSNGSTYPDGNGNDTSVVYGKILRIDPLAPSATPGSSDPMSANGKYRVPDLNPFEGPTAGVDEIFAYGLRNPWRIGIDRQTGAIYAGDVGQTQREEVDLITSGGNYGWVYKEGTITTPGTAGGIPAAAGTLIDPIAEYTHTDGIAIIGGTIYRGQEIPELVGKYVFGELEKPGTGLGRLFHMEAGGGVISEFFIGSSPARLYGFGEDKDGELYAMYSNGTVARIIGRQYAAASGTWSNAANWFGGLPGGIGASANFFGRGATTATTTVTLDGNRTVGFLRFSSRTSPTAPTVPTSYNIIPGSGGTLTISNAGSATPALVLALRGSHTISAPVSIVSNTTLDIASGAAVNFAGSLAVGSANTLTKTGAGEATIAGPLSFATNASVAVNAGTLTFAQGAGLAPKPNNVNTSGTGKLDLKDNRLIIIQGPGVGSWNGSAYTGTSGQIASGRGDGTWNGTNGILTSLPAADSGLTTLGVATAQQALGITGNTTAAWSGQTVFPGNVLVMYTYAGDLNLSGAIDPDDYALISFNDPDPSATGYYNGDINYDGDINADDFALIDFNFNAQGTPFPVGAVTSVPEPSACGFAVLTASALIGARRRKRRADSRG